MQKIKMFVTSLSKFDKRGEHEVNSQFYYQPSTGRLYVVYDDDHDDENENGSHPLHDVTDQFSVRFEADTQGTDLQSLDSEVNSRQAEAQSGAGEKGRL